MVKASIVIPTWNRPEALAACLRSLDAQTEQAFERIILCERGSLAALRNQGLWQARAPVVCFLDDDVLCPPTWLSSLLAVFQRRPEVLGVTGPAIISYIHRASRDLFRYPRLKRLYDLLFLYPDQDLPGRITCAGAFTTAAAEPTCTYEGPVHYLEACNMSFRTEALRSIGGFDEAYRGIGDWSELDCCFRLRSTYRDDCCWFSPTVELYHTPATTGAYLLRRHTGERLSNYYLFAKRWVKPSFRHTLYRGFLWSYYAQKELRVWLS